MKALLNKLTPTEIDAVCFFANRYIEQIPHITIFNVDGLDRKYLIKTIKANQDTLSETMVVLTTRILKKNLERLK